MLAAVCLAVATVACSTGGPDDSGVATAVAETLTALPTSTPSAAATVPPPSQTASPAPTGITPAPTATPAPPPDGVSLNCDGSYQWVRLIDGGAEGRSLIIDNWDGSAWHEAWRFDGGDPMIRQIQPEAGAVSFGGCQQLIVVPLVYTGSGAVLELTLYEWTGDDAVEVFSGDGIGGSWEHQDELLTLEGSVYLYGEPNCCPCNRQIERYAWNGTAFIEQGISLNPTYEGEAPPMCTGS